MSDNVVTKKNFLWKVFFVLLILSFAAAAGSLPYVMSLGTGPDLQIPPALAALAVFLQSFLLSGILAFAGLKLSLGSGLGAPIFEDLLYGRKYRINWMHELKPAVILGVICGAVLILLDYLILTYSGIEAVSEAPAPVWWKGALASFYGGISEEIMMRLFAMNLVIVILNRIDGAEERKSSGGKVLAAMILSSVVFGIGHIAAAATSFAMSPMLVIRVIILNFIPGMIFGGLYWKRSLLSAMAGHFTADITLHVISRALIDSLA